MNELANAVALAVPDAKTDQTSIPLTVDVPVAQWKSAATCAFAAGATFLDFLTAVDRAPLGIEIVAHLFNPANRDAILVRTLLDETAEVDSVTDLWASAGWHERETFEMFGVAFIGHEDLRPLLLDPAHLTTPLRKSHVLAARAVTPWPGTREPGADERRARRRAPSIPGVPDGWLAPQEDRGDE